MKFENVCRTCLRIPESLLSLVENKDLLHKIKKISSVEIDLEDNLLPLWICKECVENVNESFNFRKVIINSDIKLKEERDVLFTNRERLRIEENATTVNSDSDFNENCSLPNETIDGNDRSDTVVGENKNDTNYARTKSKNSTKEEAYKCTKCNYECAALTELNSHKKSHVLRKVCDTCGKTVTAYNFAHHLKSHKETSVKCPHPGCDKTFKTSPSLRDHLKALHDEGGAKYQCEYCGKSYSYRSGYYQHKKRHGGDGTKCEICNKVLLDKSRMKKHMRHHTGERPYSCEYCGKGYKSRYAQSVHRRIHTKEKPYKCDYCNQAFRIKILLQTHIKSKHKNISETL